MTPSTEVLAGPPVNSGARVAEGQVELLKDAPDLIPVVPDLCEITDLSAQTLRALINAGKLPGCRIGRRLYVPKSLLIKYIEKGI